MTTTYRDEVRGRTADTQQQQGGFEQESSFEGIFPILLAAMASRRQEQEGIHPLLIAALMARRQEREGGIAPILLAALVARHREQEEQGEGIHPLLLAALVGRQRAGRRWRHFSAAIDVADEAPPAERRGHFPYLAGCSRRVVKSRRALAAFLRCY